MKPHMYKVLRLTALAAVAALVASSCIRDNIDTPAPNSGGFKPGMAATLTFDPSFEEHETRAGYETYGPAGETFPEGNALDSKMTTFRVLIYDNATGDLMKTGSQGWNYLIDATTEAKPYKISVATGTYKFVFIANEKSLNSKLGAEGSAGAEIDTFAELAALDFSYPADSNPADITGGADPDGNGLAGSGTTGANVTIPMVCIYEGVQVSGANAVSTDGGVTTLASPWAVPMVRTAIRISAHLNIAPEQYKAWKAYSGTGFPEILFDGLQDRTHFVPDTPNLGGGSSQTAEPLDTKAVPVVTAAQMTDPSIAAGVARGEYGVLKLYKNGTVDNSTATPDSAVVFIERLIFPELVFSPASVETNSLRMSMCFDDGAGGVDEKAVLLHAPNTSSATGYTLPRNSWLWLDGYVSNELDVTARVLPWNDGDLEDIEERNYNFTVDHEILVFRNNGGTREINIFTDHPAGWELDAATVPGWITTFTPVDGVTGSESTVTVTASAGTSGSTQIQRDEIIVESGNLRKKIIVIRLPDSGDIVADTSPANVSMYVGAFWKAGQYGERLIRITRPTTGNVSAIDGDWIATVIEGEDWIELDKEVSKDHNVGWRTDVTPNEALVDNGNDPDFDIVHRVNSNETSVTGRMSATDPQIYFRLGLDTPSYARYGVVLLIYSTGGPAQLTEFHKIYVRQGEDPDYLMLPTDPATGAITGQRTAAVKFSPYNLTAETLSNGTSVNVSVNSMDNPTGPNPPRFTDYPTQAGAFFQHQALQGGSFERYAWDPITLPLSLSMSQWGSPPSTSLLWSDVYEQHETCPQDYTLSSGVTVDFRRPTDGPTDIKSSMTSTSDIQLSEMRQSLYKNITTGAYSSDENVISGYYADGFFDRRAIGTSPSGVVGTAVSVDNNDIAYKGALIYNDVTAASLFMPFSGRRTDDSAQLLETGTQGYYYSSSINNNSNPWQLRLSSINTGLMIPFGGDYRWQGSNIRCVVDD